MQPTPNPNSGEGRALPFVTLPLWHWAANKAALPTSTTIPRAVRHIAAKGRISIAHAAVVANLMGFNSEAIQ
jgi:hypothetical protein